MTREREQTPGEHGASLEFYFDGRPVGAHAGQSVAIALWDAGIRVLRASPVDRAPRGMFCAIGVCQECVVMIDDVRRPACATLVRAGLQVRSISAPSTGPGR